MARYSQAQNKATQKFIKNAYDDIKIRVPKGQKSKYQNLAADNGKSLNQYVIDLMDKDAARMGKNE